MEYLSLFFKRMVTWRFYAKPNLFGQHAQLQIK